MYSILMGIMFVGLFGGYIALAAMADHAEYEKEQHDRWGDNP